MKKKAKGRMFRKAVIEADTEMPAPTPLKLEDAWEVSDRYALAAIRRRSRVRKPFTPTGRYASVLRKKAALGLK